MKRFWILICAAALAVCFVQGALAAGPREGFVLPKDLKTLPADAESAGLPENLPAAAQVTDFSVVDGLITVKLDREVAKLVITELDFITGTESTIFSKKNTDSAETYRTGREGNILFIRMDLLPRGEGSFTEEYNTWTGALHFNKLVLTEDTGDGVTRESSFREDGTLASLTWNRDGGEDFFSLAESFDTAGQAESCLVNWHSLDYYGYITEAELTAEGEIRGFRYMDKKTNLTVRSIPADADTVDLGVFMDNSFNPGEFGRQVALNYPEMTASIVGISTATDLPPEADAGEVTENTRVWEVAYGDYFENDIYVFITDDPLFVTENGRIVPNREAKDMYGKPISFSGMPSAETAVFEAPAFAQ